MSIDRAGSMPNLSCLEWKIMLFKHEFTEEISQTLLK
jgi:hypothetical protein